MRAKRKGLGASRRELRKCRDIKSNALQAKKSQQLITTFMQVNPITPAAYERIRQNSYLGSISRRLKRRKCRWPQRTLRDCGMAREEHSESTVTSEIEDSRK